MIWWGYWLIVTQRRMGRQLLGRMGKQFFPWQLISKAISKMRVKLPYLDDLKTYFKQKNSFVSISKSFQKSVISFQRLISKENFVKTPWGVDFYFDIWDLFCFVLIYFKEWKIKLRCLSFLQLLVKNWYLFTRISF